MNFWRNLHTLYRCTKDITMISYFLLFLHQACTSNAPFCTKSINDITLPLSHYIYVRSGLIALTYGTLRVAGNNGYSWSRIATVDINSAYWLRFDSTTVYVLNHYDKYYAFPVRCHISIMRNSVLTSGRMCRYASKKLRKCL